MNKPASQSPDTFLQGSASKAVDGDTTDKVDRGMCAHTDRETLSNPAWWTVDLEETFNLMGIKIYNRDRHGELKGQFSCFMFLYVYFKSVLTFEDGYIVFFLVVK